MRKLLTGLLILMATTVGHASPQHFKGPGDAWPWGAEMPFPWKGIQGTWVTLIGSQTVYFKFTAVRSDNGLNQLHVAAYDSHTCAEISEGVGYEQNRIVKAVMVGQGGSFHMTVHVFRQADLKELNKKASSQMMARAAKTVTVMNISSLANNAVDRETYQLTKLDSNLEEICDRR